MITTKYTRPLKFFWISILTFGLATILFSSSYSQTSNLLESLQTEISEIINKTKHSVVTISSMSSYSYMVDKEDGLWPFSKSGKEEKKNNVWIVGSGIIYNDSGYIITKSSLLTDFEKIKVTLCDNREFDAKYIGTDEHTQLAILKIDAENLHPAIIGNSFQVKLHSLVMVLGNSMGISPFASFGLVNGFTNNGMFILSAPINPGNSGSPVINSAGEIIGIITAQLDADVSMMGPAFLDYSYQSGIALPINEVVHLADEIIKMQKEQKGWLGITFNSDSLAHNKLILDVVVPGSPAERAGLKRGDRILKVNESFLHNTEMVREIIEKTSPGQLVSINFVRDNHLLNTFARMERKRPSGFNMRKPRMQNPALFNQPNTKPIQSPVILSPNKFQEINSRMQQMENEIQDLKTRLRKYQ